MPFASFFFFFFFLLGTKPHSLEIPSRQRCRSRLRAQPSQFFISQVGPTDSASRHPPAVPISTAPRCLRWVLPHVRCQRSVWSAARAGGHCRPSMMPLPAVAPCDGPDGWILARSGSPAAPTLPTSRSAFLGIPGVGSGPLARPTCPGPPAVSPTDSRCQSSGVAPSNHILRNLLPRPHPRSIPAEAALGAVGLEVRRV